MAEETTATNTTDTQGQTQQQAPNYDEIFSKLDAILDKRSDGLAKSALKDNGIDEGEIADIVKAYRTQKQIADLQKQISDRDLDDAFSSAALGSGVDAKQLAYVIRLADRTDVFGADGKPDAGKVQAAINKVLEDVPALKASANSNNGFQPVGSKGGDPGAGSGDDADKKLRSYFGLK